jgi:hypothetical protein
MGEFHLKAMTPLAKMKIIANVIVNEFISVNIYFAWF